MGHDEIAHAHVLFADAGIADREDAQPERRFDDVDLRRGVETGEQMALPRRTVVLEHPVYEREMLRVDVAFNALRK